MAVMWPAAELALERRTGDRGEIAGDVDSGEHVIVRPFRVLPEDEDGAGVGRVDSLSLVKNCGPSW